MTLKTYPIDQLPTLKNFSNALIPAFREVVDGRYPKRDLYLLQQRLNGVTLREVAEDWNLSHERIRQIIRRRSNQVFDAGENGNSNESVVLFTRFAKTLDALTKDEIPGIDTDAVGQIADGLTLGGDLTSVGTVNPCGIFSSTPFFENSIV